MQRLEFRAMGCHMLAVIDRDDERADAQLRAVPGWFEEWEQQLSRFRAVVSASISTEPQLPLHRFM